ncbi:DUF3861 family protein [Xanthomonas sp. XNM01]|uniref:DUF3861 family protein n=1 Tax=Xanthomonas sp. XNM01 TaxID=2769289 RepID=UPI00178236FF|nr:DUF3861 family protein [Xanthomonas sp. XNM01]MBD9367846.1 DUF3861 family protein [Xanthomonas sp. XNM01]
MKRRQQRYRVTVTPVETGGLPCTGRCSIEFEQTCQDDWMRSVEGNQRLRGFSGDERTALVIGARILEGLMQVPREAQDDLLAGMRAPMAALVEELERRGGS